MTGTGFQLVEPWVGFSGGQTERGWNPTPTKAQAHLCVASCFHRGPSTWHQFLSAPSPFQSGPTFTSQNPLEALIQFRVCTCTQTHWYTHSGSVLTLMGQKNPQTSTRHVNHYTVHTCTLRRMLTSTDVDNTHSTCTHKEVTRSQTFTCTGL